MIVYKFMSLYHYCHNKEKVENQYTKECLETGKMFFNDWEQLNDPMEGFYVYDPGCRKLDIENILRNEKIKYKIFCCSKECENILMWSHYADSHRGICLKIKIDEDECQQSGISHVNVVYKKRLVELLVKHHARDKAKYILKHKLSKWRYEQEVRFFVKASLPSSYTIGKIESIMCGSRCNSEDVELIKQWNSDITVQETKFNDENNNIEAM